MNDKSKFWLIFGVISFFISLILMRYFSLVDKYVNLFFNSIGNGFFIKLATILSYITDPIFLVAFSGIMLVFLLLTKKYRNFLILAFGIGGGVLVEVLLKNIFQRVRPSNALVSEVSFSFPSGHAMISVIFFGLIVYLFKDEIKNLFWKKFLVWICALVVFVICLSRLYLNVHWFSDVIGGVGIGLILVEGIILINKMSWD